MLNNCRKINSNLNCLNLLESVSSINEGGGVMGEESGLAPVPITTSGVLKTHFQNLVEHNFPSDFNEKLRRGMPFMGASFVIWPIFWLYRGLDWGYQRQYVSLPVYIQKVGGNQSINNY